MSSADLLEHGRGPGPAVPADPAASPVPAGFRHRCVHLRDLLIELTLRDLRLRYKRSLVGFGWSLITPLAQLLVLHFVFTRVVPLAIESYAAFLFSGLLVWSWFQTSLHQATTAIIDNRGLVRVAGFPSAVLPVVAVTGNLIHFAAALPVLLVFAWASGSPPSPALLIVPLLILLQFGLTIGLAFFVAAAEVRFRDTQHLLGIVLLLGFYLSPVFYDPAAVPEPYRALYGLNPMVHLLGAYRAVILDGHAPELMPLLGIAALSALLIGTGHRVFARGSREFAEEL